MKSGRWPDLMSGFGFAANEETHLSLVAAYSEKHRHYHTMEHVNACFRHLDACANQATNLIEIELALWFHDAIYKPLASNNERKSADWAMAFLHANGAPEAVKERVRRLIMVTEHNAPAQSKDESLLLDIDLSILGSKPEVYDEFERAVRKEYWLVPAFIYRKKRKAMLEGFLRRSFIYQNEPFKSEREFLARENISNSISKLALAE